ncbi:MAG: hypothetical protein AAGA16_23285 [Cyanobacteria bacterium P01_E01_bin.35]
MSSANYIQGSTTAIETSDNPDTSCSLSFNIEIELNALAELILNSTNIPLTEYSIVDRVVFLHQLHQVKENFPIDLATATEIANCRQQIIAEAENYASLVVKSAEEKANQMLQDSSILRQAELDGAKIRLKVERECEELKQTTKNELAQLRQNAIAECSSIQMDTDNYADNVLDDLEQRLQGMLAIIQNGRQQLDQS